MTRIKKIGVMQAAKIQGLFGVILGLIFGLFVGILGSSFSYMMYGGNSGGFGFFAIIVLPIMYGIFGFIAGAIGALLYNLIAGWIGGLDIELEEIKEVKAEVK